MIPFVFAALLTTPPATVDAAGRTTPPAELASSVALFWRSDCAPCLLELGDVAALRRVAAPLRLRPVNLDPPSVDADRLRRALARAGADAGDGLRASGDPAEVLAAYGGAPPRLPLAVAFDANGRACGRRSGLLGYDHLRAWAADCARAGAARR